MFDLDNNTRNSNATNEAYMHLGMFQNFTTAGSASADRLRASWDGGNAVIEHDLTPNTSRQAKSRIL